MATKVPDSRLGRLGKLVGLSGRVGGSLLARTASKIAGRDPSWADRKTAEQLVATLGQLKGLAQKIGQAISMDIDHVPAEMREIISALQSKSEPMDYPAIAAVVTQELGAPPEALFGVFQQKPLAAASLGQVHRAVLRDGRKVAVKVQYPGAAKALQADLKNIDALLRTFTGVFGQAGASFKGHGYFHEIATELMAETDYRREARNARDFRAVASAFSEIQVPEVIEELSASRVLTLELLDGEPLADLLKRADTEENELRLKVSAGIIAALYGPLLSRGMIHVDPHPGNFLVMPGGKLGVLDFGAIKYWSPALTSSARTVYRGILDNELPPLDSLLREAGFDVAGVTGDVKPVLAEFFRLLRGPVKSDFFDFGATTIAAEFEAAARRNVGLLVKIRPPAEALMFFRAFGGQGQNLRALRAAGNFGDIYRSVFRRAVASSDGKDSAA